MAYKKRNYLNNKDLLLEIHRSKASYSSFTCDENSYYDFIVNSIEEIEPSIEEARIARAKRLERTDFDEACKHNLSAKVSDHLVDTQSIPTTDIVFRVMTFDHIPLDATRKRNPKTTAEHHVKLNFPPFQHWKYDLNGFLRCVGKSHWRGDVETGHFSKTHGSPTHNLAQMWMKLCERYCTRGNVRSYTYNDEMQGHALMQLAEVGLQFNEAKSNNPFSYSTTVIANACIRVINTEKTNQTIRDDILESNNMDASHTYYHQYEWEAALRRNLTEQEIERINYVQKGSNLHRLASGS